MIRWSVSPGTADAPVGAPGTVRGVTGELGADGNPSPAALVAMTVNVYDVPFVSPVTVQDNAAVLHVAPPGEAVTV